MRTLTLTLLTVAVLGCDDSRDEKAEIGTAEADTGSPGVSLAADSTTFV